MLNKQLSDIDTAIENLMKAIEQGQHMELLSERITKKQQEKAEVEKAIAIEQMQYVSLSESEIKFFLTRLKNGDITDIQYQRMILTVLIHSVYLYDDGRLLIIFNAGNKQVVVDTEWIIGKLENDKSGSYLKDYALPRYSKNNTHFYYFRGGFSVIFWGSKK